MIGEYTSEGWEARLRPHGVGRFFPAAFLALWLCGWLAGEAFVLGVLALGVRSLLTGQPLRPGHAALEWGSALAVGAFLVVWLVIWTFGGIAALSEFLRLVWSEDRILARADGVSVQHRMGPFRTRREVARQDIRWIETAPRSAVLVAETAAKTIQLSNLGSREERAEVAAMLRGRFGMTEHPDPTSEPGALPEGWVETSLPEGGFALTSDPARRHAKARAVTAIAMLSGAVAVGLAIHTWNSAAALPLFVMFSAAAAGIAWGAWRLHHVRGEWVIEGGRMVLRRRSGSTVRDLFEGRSLELTVTTDSDGDEWYALDALASAEPEPEAALGGHRPGRTRHRITQMIHDPSTPRHLGVWLAQRANVPFRDRAEPKARDEELQRLREQLEQSGGLGHLAAKLLDRAEDRERRV
jgi:hypothetical protein